MKSPFFRHSLLLFLALRCGDAVSIAAGLWFVPKFVSPEEIGAVLPLTSFATFLSLPLFALAMTAMKESAHLAAANERGKVKSLLRGVFVSVAIMIVLGLAATTFAIPRFLSAMGVSQGHIAGLLAVVAAFLGCAAPVYTDALQALKRFRSLGVIEAGGSIMRFAVMYVAMPFNALAGYFAGAASLPAFRIACGLFALRRDLAVKADSYWTRPTVKRFARSFCAVLAYQAVPMFAALVEQSVLRTSLSTLDSAGYYMASRFSDFLYYVTTPLLLVVFPYAAYTAQKGSDTRPFVVKCCIVTLAVAVAMTATYLFWGKAFISLMPNGVNYADYAQYMPFLTLITALTSCQVFYTNVEVSAGRFGFLSWLIPLHLAYPLLLWCFPPQSLPVFIVWMAAVSLLRFVFSAASMHRSFFRVLGYTNVMFCPKGLFVLP